jgi:hypothetical protein
MATGVSVDQTADRAALVRKVALVHKVRRLADEVESLYRGLDQAGALAEIRRYSTDPLRTDPASRSLANSQRASMLRGNSIATRQHSSQAAGIAFLVTGSRRSRRGRQMEFQRLTFRVNDRDYGMCGRQHTLRISAGLRAGS